MFVYWWHKYIKIYLAAATRSTNIWNTRSSNIKKKYLAKAGIFVNAKEEPTKTEPKNYNSFLDAAQTHLLAKPRYTAHANF